MSENSAVPQLDSFVPDEVIPAGTLPPLRYRDLPESIPLRKMLGPSIILAGLALGSGEFVLWPYITYKAQFVFFWACLLGVLTQYFLNMEITRWALATGESAITGFIRLNKHWAWVFLLLNVIPWMIPAWATGAAELFSWMVWEPQLVFDEAKQTLVIETTSGGYQTWIAIAGMFGCGIILTAGPVIYETVERIQIVLVSIVILLIVVLAFWLVRWESVVALFSSTLIFGFPDFFPDQASTGLDPVLLLGALAFAGAGGTTNLGQSNYIKDKGYGMGVHVGRITSPITGQVESVTEIGFHFPATEENSRRWRQWWKSACWEHSLSFLATCVFCLVLLALISHSVFYENEVLRAGMEQYGKGMDFVLGEANEVGNTISPMARNVFLFMGIVILLTTEFGVLDAASRISTDVVKVAWLRENKFWSESRLYYAFLWGSIFVGSGILMLATVGIDVSALQLFKLTAAMNGGVMFLYCFLLLYMNRFKLPASVRINWWRSIIMVWAVLFFGAFAIWAAVATISKIWADLFG
jgi:hypothetical protein